MTFKETKELIKKDLSAVTKPTKFNFFKYLWFNAGFKTTFWFRLCHYHKNKKGLLHKTCLAFCYLKYKNVMYRTGIQLNINALIGGGIRFAHYSCIVVNESSVVGENCVIFQGVTLGSTPGKGAPILGNNVVVAAGAKVIGNVKIGNYVFVGANAVVTRDIPDNAVVVGAPAKIINYNGIELTKAYTDKYK